jgi:nitroreductase
LDYNYPDHLIIANRFLETILDVLTAIHTRQSIPKVLPDPVPRPIIEQLLDAAVQAPNHHRNRPWRFVVLTGAARERLGNVLARSLAARLADTPDAVLEVERHKPLRAPLLIAVGIDPPDGPKILEIENICAGAAAVQNLLLAAHALGLGAFWRTGASATDPAVKAFLGFPSDETIIAFVYLGYPDLEREPPTRAGYADRTSWMEEVSCGSSK